MKKLLCLMFFVYCSVLSAQIKETDDLYFSPEKRNQSDTSLIKNEVDNIRYNLGKYHKARQTGISFSIAGAAVTTLTLFVLKDSDAQQALLFIGGISSFAGLVIIIDAEKWLKRASISISPGSVKFNF